MGYSIYLLTGETDNKTLRRTFGRREIREFDCFTFRAPVFHGSDLAYAKDEHKDRLVFGMNFSAEYELAHAVVATVANLLDREKYWHDGHEMIKVKDAIWWHKPKKQLSVFRRWDLWFNRKEYKEIDKLLAAIKLWFVEDRFFVKREERRSKEFGSEC